MTGVAASWRQLLALAWRDSRTVRRRLLLFMSSISVGVAALVAIDSYAGNVTRSIRVQSRSLLGGDLAVSARQPFTPAADSLLDSLERAGTPVARVISFASMAVIRNRPGTRLVQVRAVEPGYPFYGTIETRPLGRWEALQSGQAALVDPSLLVNLSGQIGDTLSLGNARFVIIGTIENVPGDVGVASAFGSRVFIPASAVPATGLLVFGSRSEHEALLQLRAADDPDEWRKRLRQRLDTSRVRVRTVQQTERNLTEGVQQLHHFLGIVGMVALLLGGIGVASGIHAYVSEKIDTVAVLRCLGATTRQVFAIYTVEAAAMGLAGAFAGVALGVLTQFALPRVIGDFVPVDVTPTIEPAALLAGLITGLWVALIFAMRPLLAVRRVSPLQAIRRTVSELPRVPLWRDLPRALAALALLGSLVLIAVLRTSSARQAAAMLIAIGGALVVLWLAAAVLSGLARRSVRERWPFVLRQGIANLYRPGNQTRAIMLSLGFGAFLISTLYLTQANLLRHLTLSAEATRANIAFFDVQEDQIRPLDSLVRAEGHPIIQQVPIVPMRVAEIGGRTATQVLADSSRRAAGWAVRREYRSSYRDSVVPSEKIIAGRWFTPAKPPAERFAEVSLEREIASELGVGVGDSIVWDVQGVRVATVVSNLREVNWARFEPNFFAVFEPGALDAAPASYVLLTGVSDALARARLQRSVVDRFPNVSSIDLSTIRETISRILGKVSVAIRFMAVFSVITGALVLFSAVAATRRQRLREAVLLKTLGATRAQIRRILLSEYAALGLLGATTGAILSFGGAWAVVHFIFELPFAPALVPIGVLALAVTLFTMAIGVLSARRIFAETPMAALREA